MNVIAPQPVFPSPSMNSPPRHDPSGKVVTNVQRGKHRPSSNTSSLLDRQNAQRKRQRRQAAGQLVTGLFAGGGEEQGEGAVNNSQSIPPAAAKAAPDKPKPKKKSTAQPRPEIQVPPRGIGPVQEPNNNDVLCGRGGRINAHTGNVRFRDIVVQRKKDYLDPKTKKLEKAHIAAEIVRGIRAKNPPGRFLKEDPDGSWYDIGDAKAIKKVGQALREDAPDIREEIASDEEKDDKRQERKPSASAPVQPLATVAIGGGTGTATAVSSRGAKVASAPSQRSVASQESYTPLAYQNISAPPASYQPILPPQHEPGSTKPIFAGMRGRGAKPVSGAAAAAIAHDNPSYPPPPTHDIAFGRSFHVPDAAGESSMISGMSGGTGAAPSALSGMSGISALTDPISALSNEGGRAPRPTFQQPASRPPNAQQFQAMRYNQLQQLRQQWAQGGPPGSQRTLESADLRSIDNQSLGIMSLQRSHSWQEGQPPHDTMSWADHSLLGGGINDVNSVMSGQQSFHSYYLRDQPMGAGHVALGGGGFPSNTSGPSETAMLRAGSSGLGGSTAFAGSSLALQNQPVPPPHNNPQHPMTNPAQLYQGGSSNSSHGDNSSSSKTNRMAGGVQGAPSSNASVASMSIASGSLSGSIMSDLSENLVALDLAEPRLLDRMQNQNP